VKGVLTPFGVVGFLNLDETAFISLMGARLTFKLTYYSGVYVIANSPEDVATAQADVQSYFGTNARIMSAQSMLETVQSITGQLTFFMGGIAAVSLFVAGVGIANTMFVSIMERTREIGVMKAIGYKASSIMMMFLAEASITGIVGGLLGTVTGSLLSFLLSGGLSGMGMGMGPRMGGGSSTTTSSGFTPVITPDLVMFSLLFPIGISILAGLYPAWRASKLNIVTALKYE
jgi:ABC-type antimicrobial peptide transport system permease subunit